MLTFVDMLNKFIVNLIIMIWLIHGCLCDLPYSVHKSMFDLLLFTGFLNLIQLTRWMNELHKKRNVLRTTFRIFDSIKYIPKTTIVTCYVEVLG